MILNQRNNQTIQKIVQNIKIKKYVKNEKTLEIEPRDVRVTITTPVISNTQYDPQRVLLLLVNSTEEIPIFYTTVNSYKQDLSSLTLDPATSDQLLASLDAYFSNQQQSTKIDCLVGAVMTTTVLSDYFDLVKGNEFLQFGFMCLVGQGTDDVNPIVTGSIFRKDISNFTELLQSANSLPFPAQMVVYELDYNQDIQNTANLIQIVHYQADISDPTIPTSGYIMEKYIGYLAFRLSSLIAPNYNAFTTLPASVGLLPNAFPESQSIQIESTNMNQFKYKNGLTRMRIGVNNDGFKIERFAMLNRVIPFYLQSNLEVWQENTQPRQSTLQIFATKLAGLLLDLQVLGITGISPLLGNSSYIIDNVSTSSPSGIAQFDAQFRIAYDNTIVNINLFGNVVDVA